MELRLIDFEDAVYFDRPISQSIVITIIERNDYRYPFRSGDERVVQFAQQYHNTFFFYAIKYWLSSNESEFRDFMCFHGSNILEEVINTIDKNEDAIEVKRKRLAGDDK